jgi:hypothetical protein
MTPSESPFLGLGPAPLPQPEAVSRSAHAAALLAPPDHFGPIQVIAWEEALKAGITYAQIIGRRRSAAFMRPRHVAMWRAARETAACLPEIGRVFSNRDHSSVLYAIRKVDRLVGVAGAP